MNGRDEGSQRSTVVSLSSEEWEYVRRLGTSVSIAAGQSVFREGAPACYVYIIDKGHVKISRNSPLGKVVTVSIRKAGDVVGIAEALGGMERCCFAETLEACTLWKLDREKFIEMLYSRPALAVKVATALGNRLREAENLFSNMVALEVDRRLARLLVSLADRFGVTGRQGIKIDIPLAQQDLATMIGSCRQTVTTTLQKLKDEGLIATGKKSLEVLDVAALRRIADS